MYGPEDVKGLMAMMPAFSTEDAGDIRATNTIHVANLQDAVDRMVKDGAGVITTTGSFGECHTLVWDEFQTIIRAAIEAVDNRVPLFLGCTSTNTRETYQKMKFVRDAGGQGVLIGVPYYDASTVENCIRFYYDLADAFPDLSIMVYHNPVNHHIHIPVAAFSQISKHTNVVGMKDSHRTPLEFMRLQDIIRGKISVLVNQAQLYPYYEMGARGCWSIDAWMGPWPVLAALKACRNGDWAAVQEIIADITNRSATKREAGPTDNAGRVGLKFAGYCDPGPNRPPFLELSEAAMERQRKRGEHWKGLCAKYRPQVEALAAV